MSGFMQSGPVLDEWPPVRVERDARSRIRAAHLRAGRRIAVLDDDPTGSQTVHQVACGVPELGYEH
jgi:hypothetical protein